MRNRSTLNALRLTKRTARAQPHPVDGFCFVLDDPLQPDPLENYTPPPDAPAPDGLVYVDDKKAAEICVQISKNI